MESDARVTSLDIAEPDTAFPGPKASIRATEARRTRPRKRPVGATGGRFKAHEAHASADATGPMGRCVQKACPENTP